MEEIKRNYYGSLCTEMYEILHKEAPQEELEFYLSYAEKEMSILEPLCGSGRFFVPFLKRGFYIKGIDNSQEMLEKLLKKAPAAPIVQSDIEDYPTEECFDYIFISSGSVSLFTDRQSCISILSKMKALLKKDGKFVFAVDTVADRCPDSNEYTVGITVFNWFLSPKAIMMRRLTRNSVQRFMNCMMVMNCCSKRRWIFRPICTN